MKKKIQTVLTVLLALFCMTGCGSAQAASDRNDGRLKIVATIFPEYDWVLNVLGGNPAGADVRLLLDKGIDLHSYQPTAADIRAIADCDLFIYVGGESDSWVKDALAESVNPDLVTMNLLEVLGSRAKEEEAPEGAAAEEGEEEAEEAEYDEHIWLSLKNAEVLVTAIKDAICQKDPANQAVYEANAKEYCQQLARLDEAYQAAVNGSPLRTILFGDRYPFRYLADDYGLKAYAAFSGCSAETEASFETILFLAGKMDEEQLPCILKIEGSDGKIARTILNASRDPERQVLTMNSMQGEIPEGNDYLEVMKENLDVLKSALDYGKE